MSDLMELMKNRRTIRRFKPDPVAEEKVEMILEAGRWAPSFSNLQPWKFVVIKDPVLKKAVDTAAKESVLHWGIDEAPVVVLVCADRRVDPLHAIEAGAAVTQNMTLMAHSLGMGTGWIGIMGTEAETAIQKILKFPETMRIISLIPIGIPRESPKGVRKPLEELVEIR
jgi:nitroreductase